MPCRSLTRRMASTPLIPLFKNRAKELVGRFAGIEIQEFYLFLLWIIKCIHDGLLEGSKKPISIGIILILQAIRLARCLWTLIEGYVESSTKCIRRKCSNSLWLKRRICCLLSRGASGVLFEKGERVRGEFSFIEKKAAIKKAYFYNAMRIQYSEISLRIRDGWWHRRFSERS